jgi:hypothetical protein
MLLETTLPAVLETVVGLAEKLAEEDPERFIWAGEAFFLKHARRNNGKSYSQRQVRYCLTQAESLGLLIPAEKVRNGVSRTGLIVRHHDSVTNRQGTRCLLWLEPGKPSRAQGQKRHSFIKGKSASGSGSIASSLAPIASLSAEPISSASGAECLSECPSECLSQLAQDTEIACDLGNQVTDCPPRIVESCQAEPSNPVSPIKESPVNENPADQHWILDGQPVTCSLSVLDDLDQKRQPSGDLTGEVCSDVNFEAGVGDLSDQEFDCTFLKSYAHTDELMWACNAALNDLRDTPFEGRKSRARVMGLAMERLRSVHKLEAPRGWLPAMKRLRTVSPEQRSLHGEENRNRLPILFCIEAFSDQNQEMRKLIEQEPRLKELLDAVAEKIGTPNNYQELGWYLNAVMSCLRPVPAGILRIRNEADRWIGVGVTHRRS